MTVGVPSGRFAWIRRQGTPRPSAYPLTAGDGQPAGSVRGRGMEDRLDLFAASRPNISLAAWARGRDAFAWHARIAALGATALVLANVALSPDRMWSAWPLTAWAALLLVHAGIVALSARGDEPATSSPAVVPLEPATVAVPGPLFAADSPAVERPRFRPTAFGEAVGVAAAPVVADSPPVAVPETADSVHVSAIVAPVHGAIRPIADAPTQPAREDLVVGTATAHGPNAPSVASLAPAAAATRAGTIEGERQDVAVSVVVLPEGAARSAPAAGRVTQPTEASPSLPAHVVALWATPSIRPAPATDWGAPTAPDLHDRPASLGWPPGGESASAP